MCTVSTPLRRRPAIVDASNFVLGSNGLVAHLDEIGFDYTESDAADVLAGIIAE